MRFMAAYSTILIFNSKSKIMALQYKINKKMRVLNNLKVVSMFIGLLFTYCNVIAQNQDVNPRKAEISIIARVDADSVVLRWAPSTPGGWVVANKIGYVVEKLKVEEGVEIENSGYKPINNNPLKPLSLEEWKLKATPENKFSAVAAQAVYGKSFNPKPLDESNMNMLKNASDELSNRYSFALFAADNDASTAEVLGLRFVDKSIENGGKYVYRVYVAEKTDEYSFDTAYIVVDIKSFQKGTIPQGLRYENSKGAIKLFWEENEPYPFSGYYIFRSDDNGKTYKKLNQMPLINMTPGNAAQDAQPMFMDTTVVNYINYKYQVKGVTPFGELSDAAEISAFARDMVAPPAPKINKPEQVSGKEVKISWELKNAPADLQGFIVSRSNNSLDGYQLITKNPLPKNSTYFIDDMGGEFEAYYVVASVDTAGNMAFSLPVLATRIDTIPPAVPHGLAGKISETGMVTLTWNKGKEKNLIGYRVLRANDISHEFTQHSPQIFTDTVYSEQINIKTLTRNIYYRIVAVNNRYQHSEMSPVLALKRPDIIAPAEAVFGNVIATDSSVILKWYPSPSSDVAKQVLFRKKQNEPEWVTLDSLAPKTSDYADKNVETNTVYLYTVISIDSSGLVSKEAAQVMARPYDNGKRPPVQNLTAQHNANNKIVNLSWNYTPVKKEKYWFVIYKAIGEGDFKEYKAVKETELSFIDNKPTTGNSSYGIVVKTSAGGESEMVTTSLIIDEE